MRGINFYLFSILIALLFSISAVAEEVSGKTADGCSYKIINGQYMTSCPTQSAAVKSEEISATISEPTQTASAVAVTSYSNVPVRHNPAAAPPALPPQQPIINAQTPIGSVSSAIENADSATRFEAYDDGRRILLRDKLIDQTYVGIQIGASNMKESNSGSATGFGLNIGSNVDDTFSVELGYSYAKQKINLGLASRGTDQPPPFEPTYVGDSDLSTNLFTLELQAHLTDPFKRLRPYLGAGLGWRASTLSESATAGEYGSSLEAAKLHQNALGGLLSAGTKLKLSRVVQLSFAFRYFLPIARQQARLELPRGSYAIPSSSETKLTKADDALTGSSQYQFLGGLQILF